MLFEWDEANVSHIAEHGIAPQEVEYVLEHHTLDVEYQDWHEEDRFSEAGATASGRVLIVITTWRDDRLRVVTAFDAPSHVVKEYLESW